MKNEVEKKRRKRSGRWIGGYLEDIVTVAVACNPALTSTVLLSRDGYPWEVPSTEQGTW